MFPDYLLLHPDGYWDILDLKRAALGIRSIVLGFLSRPRFHHYVADMIAQLARYQQYFDCPENSKWALDNLGVQIRPPKLIGIVGNFDTFVSDEVDIALKQHRDNLAILSYSDLTNLLRRNGRTEPHAK